MKHKTNCECILTSTMKLVTGRFQKKVAKGTECSIERQSIDPSRGNVVLIVTESDDRGWTVLENITNCDQNK